uniref:Putative secreted protein n=1 Tax=Ixodes scapularis TaxID=6945 RepID=A0A4D5RCB3_IXOSC
MGHFACVQCLFALTSFRSVMVCGRIVGVVQVSEQSTPVCRASNGKSSFFSSLPRALIDNGKRGLLGMCRKGLRDADATFPVCG